MKFTTSLCFYETLTLLKVNHFYKKTLNLQEYYKATLDLCSWFGAVVVPYYPEPKFLSSTVFFEGQKLVDKHQKLKLDLSDAFQIISVKDGFASYIKGGSQTILVTADSKLAIAARSEGLRVWSVLEEPAP